jgi:hypothetical protein
VGSVNFSEKEHEAVAMACLEARDHGDMTQARTLNALARKMDAQIAVAGVKKLAGNFPRQGGQEAQYKGMGPLDVPVATGRAE